MTPREEAEREIRESLGMTTNNLAQWMMRNEFATGHGDTAEALLEELASQVNEIRGHCRKMHRVLILMLGRVEANPMESVGITGLAVEVRTLLGILPDYSYTDEKNKGPYGQPESQNVPALSGNGAAGDSSAVPVV